jgi:hypothetical protein
MYILSTWSARKKYLWTRKVADRTNPKWVNKQVVDKLDGYSAGKEECNREFVAGKVSILCRCKSDVDG